MSDDLFRAKAPGVMRQLMADLSMTQDDAAAVLGNIGHECAGFTLLQEQGVATRGGYGWAQWTGPRRTAYEAYCRQKGKNPASDAANYGYLLVELTGTESGAVAATKRAPTLYDKVVAFEASFERAGIKNYPSRLRYAQMANAAFAAAAGQPAAPAPFPPQTSTTPSPKPKPPSTGLAALLAAILDFILSILKGFRK